MAAVEVRDMDAATEYFVATCSHVNESEEIDGCARRRMAWLRAMHDQGLRVKVALLEGKPVGFVYLMPIEVCPWGPLGEDLAVLPCLWVIPDAKGKGAGRALVSEAEREARAQGMKGLATVAHYHDFWFMPASFFEHLGFEVAERRGKGAILWKAWDATAEQPRFLEPQPRFEPAPQKVVVDLFWNTFCETSDIEAQRVREVVAEFGDEVALREHNADDRATLMRYQLSRGIFVNGEEIGWGYEAPKEGVREAIAKALRGGGAE